VTTDQNRPAGEPRTIVERLDAARDGAEFAAALNLLFGALERAARADDEADDD